MSEPYRRDPTKLFDTLGRARSQSLILELGYSPDAIFTLNDEDKIKDGRLYYSLKKLYMEHEDLLEINFANEVFINWNQWVKLSSNAMFKPYIDKWRNELELQVRAAALKSVIDMAIDEGSGGFQASKWLVEKGWIKREAGRPSKEDVGEEMEKRIKIASGFEDDLKRLDSDKMH